MGHFSYSKIGQHKVEKVEATVNELVEELWLGKVTVLRIEGVSIGKQDDRRAKWAFLSTEPKWKDCDAMFSISLVDHGRLEFKLPVSDEKQEKLRRVLVGRFR